MERRFKMSQKNQRYLCYTFIGESASTVDYELMADALAVQIGYAASLTGDLPEVHKDLLYLLEMVYHLNGSVRGKLAIHEEDLHRLNEMYDLYTDSVKDVREKTGLFALPQGSTAACALHDCRNRALQTVRALHKLSLEKEIPKILFDYANLLGNLFFLMALYVNKKLNVDEIPYISKSYKIKGMTK